MIDDLVSVKLGKALEGYRIGEGAGGRAEGLLGQQ